MILVDLQSEKFGAPQPRHPEGDDVVALRFAESRLPSELVPLVEVLEQRALDGPTGN